jgi:hypothetical protein
VFSSRKALAPGPEGFEDVLVEAEGGDHDDLWPVDCSDLAGRLDPVDAWHADVHEHDVGRARGGGRDGGVTVVGFADDLEVGFSVQDHGGAAADEGFIVGDEHPDGHRTATIGSRARTVKPSSERGESAFASRPIIDPLGADAGERSHEMKKILLLACTAALTASVAIGPAAAAPTRATNYETVEATCDGLGDITVEVVNRGQRGAAKAHGTNTTLIQASAHETVSYEGEVVHEERHAKGNDRIDDICSHSWSEELDEDDLPPVSPQGPATSRSRPG